MKKQQKPEDILTEMALWNITSEEAKDTETGISDNQKGKAKRNREAESQTSGAGSRFNR